MKQEALGMFLLFSVSHTEKRRNIQQLEQEASSENSLSIQPIV
ncbi:hypothetical protein [Listeria booriae]|nr:hypothetical protein [Listeria booriae]